MIVCTTGLNDDNRALLNEAAETIAVFNSANMSIGVNLIIELAIKAAATLYPAFDIEIIEKHHNEKKDAPSGTALSIANEINSSLNNTLEYVYDRSKTTEKRKVQEIGFSSIRGGTIAGEHTVLFAGNDEIVEITHTATSRDIFARGTLTAVEYMAGREKGFYNMKSILRS